MNHHPENTNCILEECEISCYMIVFYAGGKNAENNTAPTQPKVIIALTPPSQNRGRSAHRPWMSSRTFSATYQYSAGKVVNTRVAI